MGYDWFRTYSEMVRDPKIGRLTPSERWVWVGMLCLVSEAKERGKLRITDGVPYEIGDLAHVLNVDAETVESFMAKAQRLNMIAIEPDGTIVVINFVNRQYDNPSDAPENTRERKRKERERDKSVTEITSHENVTSASRECHDTDSDSDTDSDTDSDSIAPLARTSSRPASGKQPEKPIPKTRVMDAFKTITGMQFPKERKEASFWWDAVGKILDIASGDTDRASTLIAQAYSKLTDDGLTVSSPGSLVNTIRALAARQTLTRSNGNGDGNRSGIQPGNNGTGEADGLSETSRQIRDALLSKRRPSGAGT